MNTEILQIKKEETQEEINKLHNLSQVLEEMRDKNPMGTIGEKLNFFIQNLSKEIEWEEFILQEIDSSIDFHNE